MRRPPEAQNTTFDNSFQGGWPRIPGVTTVYRLMEVILEKSKRKGQPKD